MLTVDGFCLFLHVFVRVFVPRSVFRGGRAAGGRGASAASERLDLPSAVERLHLPHDIRDIRDFWSKKRRLRFDFDV